MKSTKCDKGNIVEIPYPKLMINTVGDVIFMTSSCDGVVVYSGGYNRLGVFSNEWNTAYLQDYSGTITLENSNDH
jgi:hypothetical protein